MLDGARNVPEVSPTLNPILHTSVIFFVFPSKSYPGSSTCVLLLRLEESLNSVVSYFVGLLRESFGVWVVCSRLNEVQEEMLGLKPCMLLKHNKACAGSRTGRE